MLLGFVTVIVFGAVAVYSIAGGGTIVAPPGIGARCANTGVTGEYGGRSGVLWRSGVGFCEVLSFALRSDGLSVLSIAEIWMLWCGYENARGRAMVASPPEINLSAGPIT